MEELLKHHIQDTRDRFNELKQELTALHEKLEDLRDFKISLIATSRTTSIIVSTVCGLITLIVTVFSVKK